GAVAAVAAAVTDPGAAQGSASQNWPPFVLVAGLLLIGLVAAGDRLFAAAGQRLAAVAPDGRVLFAGSCALVVAVTAILNLDTSVAFLAPVLVHTARRRKEDGAVLLCSCLLLSNAGSLLLPGSNLTNLIVLGHLHRSGGAFASRMGLAWVAAALVTALVVAVLGRHDLARKVRVEGSPERPALGLGAVSVVGATVLVIVLPSPALPVAALGVLSAGWRIVAGRQAVRPVLDVLGLPVLCGLFGVAVGLGALGRDWSGPAVLLSHLDSWGTAALAAVATILVNNLPAASLLAARTPPHPYALLVGLNLGPNLFVTGSLAWVLWLRASRLAGASPSIARTSRMGAIAVPLSMAAALLALMVTGGGA
ncbi:MAG: SLC13 family permease, partial [Acidimicrobiales bacterium]